MHTKILIRPQNFNEHYQHWLDNLGKVLLESLHGSYANEFLGNGSLDMVVENSNTYSRITWKPEEFNKTQISCLLDWIKNKILTLDYYLYLSDERVEVFDNGLRITIHRHYLKPNINSKILNYGNIILEHRFNKDNNHLCLTSNYYHNLQYLRFEKLMEFLQLDN